MDYPNAQSRVGHYGKTTLDLIEAAKAMPEGEEKNILVVKLANLMKRHFLTWNRNTVEDSVIAAELKAKSGGVGPARGCRVGRPGGHPAQRAEDERRLGASAQEEEKAPLNPAQASDLSPNRG